MRKPTSTNTLNARQLTADCPVLSTFQLLGGRWKVAILWNTALGTNRFGQYLQKLPGLSQKMLARQLKELQEDGFVQKTIFAEVPIRTEYQLTTLGKSLMPVLMQIYDWGLANNVPQRVQERYVGVDA